MTTKKTSKKKTEVPVKKTQIRSLEELEKYMHENRSRDMLTVKDLIAYLKKQDPNACILAYEQNSRAWIEQSKNVKDTICTVAEEKEKEREWCQSWYKHDPEDVREKKTEEDLKEVFRYSEDNDLCFKF